MKVFSSIDIVNAVSTIHKKNENINVFAGGQGEDKIILVKKGLKLRHIPSGLVYTVLKVIMPKKGNDLKILCQRPGKKLLIPREEFKDYERH